MKEKVKIYSIYDNEGKIFDLPFFCEKDLFAKRHFVMLMDKSGSMVSKFRENFDVYCIGEFNVIDGHIKSEQSLVVKGASITVGLDEKEKKDA